MKKVISASRRTDLVAFFPEWLSTAFKEERARVYGPSGYTYTVDLSPEEVHSVVLWSKNFSNLIEDRDSLCGTLQKYDQLYFHFTITGLGGSFIEKGVPPSSRVLSQLDSLVEIAGTPERISIRFDPVVFWKEDGEVKTNLSCFEKLAPEFAARGIENIRFSFAQWYGKAVRRAEKHAFEYIDPSQDEKKEAARALVRGTETWKMRLYSCSQDFLSEISGIFPSSCIDGPVLRSLHPEKENVSEKKDRSQRTECRCTESIDIGSYTQSCPHSCLYCYANPKV
jgi:DNA repair photolyase